MSTTAEAVRDPQSMQQGRMINSIKGGGEVEQRQDSDVAAVHCTENIRQDLQYCCLCRVTGTVRRLQVR